MCPAGQLLYITHALYGRTKDSCGIIMSEIGVNAALNMDIFNKSCLMNVWPLVTGRCSKKPTCSLRVTDSVFGQPCAETGTGIHIRYACVNTQETGSIETLNFKSKYSLV